MELCAASRYIEIFKSSLQELRNATNFHRMRSPMSGGGAGGMGRPGPYDRSERYGGGGGGSVGQSMGMGGYGRGRGRGNIKGEYCQSAYFLTKI